MILHNQKWQLTTKVPDSCRLIDQMNTDGFINRPVMKRKLKQCVAMYTYFKNVFIIRVSL
jgi:hypothetical protein